MIYYVFILEEILNLLCLDLDNTLIYSYKRDIGNEKVLVEKKEEKNLSFMTEYSYKALEIFSKKLFFVPVTTRSLEQYLRINFDNNIPIKYALVANGGILIQDGKIDENWYDYSKNISKTIIDEIKSIIKYLEKREEIYFDIRLVDDLFLFTKSNNPKLTLDYLKSHFQTDDFYIDNNKEKIYVFPSILNKGYALKRLREYTNADNIISAGDSEFDLYMKDFSYLSIFHHSLKDKIKDDENLIISNQNMVFSDFIFDVLNQRYGN